MDITFLGSGHCYPTAARHCSCAVVESGGSSCCIDAGGPVADLLAESGRSPEDLKAVFTTHVHGDHTNGLYALADLCNFAFPNACFDLFVTEPALADLIRRSVAVAELGTPLDESRVRLKIMTAGTVWDDGQIRVTPIPTKHMADQGHPSFAYLVEAEGKRVLFTGDLSQGLKHRDFPRVALEEQLDLTVCEMGHFGPEHMGEVFASYRGRAFLFQHVFPEEKEALIPELDGKWGYPIRLAADGMTVTV